jgi:hypothetical protein
MAQIMAGRSQPLSTDCAFSQAWGVVEILLDEIVSKLHIPLSETASKAFEVVVSMIFAGKVRK